MQEFLEKQQVVTLKDDCYTDIVGEVYMEHLTNQLTSLLKMLHKKKAKRESKVLPSGHESLFEIATTFFCFHNA